MSNPPLSHSGIELSNNVSQHSPAPSPAAIASPSAFKPTWRFYAIFASLCTISLAAALDATTISVALPLITLSLHGSAIKAYWTGTSFLLASTVFQPIWASLSHAFGRRNSLLATLAFFTVGALVAALAPNFIALLAGRTIQGLGGGGIIALTDVVITDLVPLRERGKWLGVLSMTWAVGTVTGPVIGGALAEKAGWRWLFWLLLPFCAVGFFALPVFLRLEKRSSGVWEEARKMDWLGAGLLIVSVTSFLLPVSWGNVMFAWSAWQTLVPLILGFGGMLGFVLYEIYLPAQPLIPLDIFRQRTAIVTYLGIFLHGIVLWCILYYLPLYYEAVKGYSPAIAGVAALPETFTVAPTSVVAGIAISITGRFRWAVWSGWALTVLGMGLLCDLSVDTPIPAWVFLNLVPGIGMGMLFPSFQYAVQAACDQKDVAFAAAMLNFVRSFGQSIGVAAGGAIFQNQFLVKLTAEPLVAHKAEQLAQDATSTVQIIKAMAKDDPDRIAIVKAYADSLRIVWAVMTGLAFVAFVLSLWTEPLDLNKDLVTEQGFRHDRVDSRSE